MDLQFNNEGVPLVGFGRKSFVETTGGPKSASGSNKKGKASNVGVVTDTEDDNQTAGDFKIWMWGADNLFPENCLADIESSTVLSSGLKYKLQLLMGQGVYPTKLEGFDDDGKEVLKVIDNPELRLLSRSRMIRNYISGSIRDVFKFGRAFPVMQFNETGDKCTGITIINGRSCRLERKENDSTISPGVIVADWRNPKDYKRIMMLDADDPDGQLEDMRSIGATKGLNCVYPILNTFSNNYFYPLPDWYVAKNAGWIDISKSIPNWLKKIYTNQITWKWHIKIPYAYWEKKYPSTEYKNKVERQKLINTDLDNFETNLIGDDNAGKAIVTHFELNPAGKAEEQWVIEPLQNKFTSEQQLIESAVADSNILFSINVNPTVMGAGLPGAGPYAGKTGGSDIRESFLVNVALSWLDRQNIIDPLECMTRFNGIKDCEWNFKSTVLTTLDKGKGTEKTLS